MGCKSQDAKCQKAHWKFHKSSCKRQQAGFGNKNVGAAATRSAMAEWIRQKDLALGVAVDEALLPSKDRPEHNLSETHVLMVNLAEFPRGSGEFEIVNARVALHEEMRKAFEDLESEQDYRDLIQKLELMRKGAERRIGAKIWGTTFTVVRCIVGMEVIMQVHPHFIKQEAIDLRMKVDSREDWIDQLKFLAKAEKMYQTPDGKIFAIANA